MTYCSETYGVANLSQGNSERPRVTLALFAYNQEAYVGAAVEGALTQDYDGPLEIILSDDGSTDRTFEILQEMAIAYRGPHNIRVRRNEMNLGLGEHFNRALSHALGKIIVVAAGDDISLSSRVSDTVRLLNSYPTAMCVSFSDILINQYGDVINAPEEYTTVEIIDRQKYLRAGLFAYSRLNINAASRAFRACVHTKFGELSSTCPTEDGPYRLRSLYKGEAIVASWAGIKYRRHSASLSHLTQLVKTDNKSIELQYFKDLKKAIDNNLISKREARLFKKWIKAEMLWKEVEGKGFNGLTLSLGEVFNLLCSPLFSRRMKMAAIYKKVRALFYGSFFQRHKKRGS